MLLDLLFHWSPSENREFILRDGLHPYSRPRVHTGDMSYPYICLSPSPSWAWGHSGEVLEAQGDLDDWDLWQVRLPDNAYVNINGFFGNEIGEIKVHSAIPADHIWWVAVRSHPLPAIEMTTKGGRRR